MLKQMATNWRAGLVAAMLLLALGLVWRHLSVDPEAEFRVDDRWFYDLNLKQLYPGGRAAQPPVEGPSGKPFEGEPAGVLAYVYGCGDCKATFIGYLEKFTPDAREAVLDTRDENRAEIGWRVKGGRLVKREGDIAWHLDSSPAGGEIRAEASQRCRKEGKSLQPCYPR